VQCSTASITSGLHAAQCSAVQNARIEPQAHPNPNHTHQPQTEPRPPTQAFDAAAALALLHYKPPDKAASDAAGDEHSPDLIDKLLWRSRNAFKYMTPKVGFGLGVCGGGGGVSGPLWSRRVGIRRVLLVPLARAPADLRVWQAPPPFGPFVKPPLTHLTMDPPDNNPTAIIPYHQHTGHRQRRVLFLEDGGTRQRRCRVAEAIR